MIQLRKSDLIAILVCAFLVGILLPILLLDAPTSDISITTVPTSDTPTPSPSPVVSNNENAYYRVNGNDKLPKLKRLFGEDTDLTLVLTDSNGKEVLRLEHLYTLQTDLNALVPPGDYTATFYDGNGTKLTPASPVSDTLTIK